jgi:hypothetical protein
MLDPSVLWHLASRLPAAFSGAFLHRSALSASAVGRFALAQRLYEAAAERYRQDLAVEALARLRTHQMITRVRSGTAHTNQELALEIVGRSEAAPVLSALRARRRTRSLRPSPASQGRGRVGSGRSLRYTAAVSHADRLIRATEGRNR